MSEFLTNHILIKKKRLTALDDGVDHQNSLAQQILYPGATGIQDIRFSSPTWLPSKQTQQKSLTIHLPMPELCQKECVT